MGKSLKGSKKVTTVWLEPETEGDHDKVKMFYCFNCRIPLIEYSGNVTEIVPGNSPLEPGTILKCKGSVQRQDKQWEECGMYYRFQGAVYTAHPEST